MKNKMILSISLLLLSACSVSHNKLSDVSQDSLLVSQFSDSTTDLVLEKEAKYRNDLIQARDKQKAYINSLSIEERNGIQTIYSAVLVKSQELIESFPNDKELIEGLVKEIVEDNGRLLSENIELIIQKYALEKKMNYRQATPATSLKYYDIAVPDELLNMLFLDQKHIAFKFYELNLGEGEIYQLNACYVSEDEKETILFVEKNGEKMVLQTDLKPENAKVQVFISQHYILNSYQNSSVRH